MGESKRALLKMAAGDLSSSVNVMSGNVSISWSSDSDSTPMGQLAYFIEFLHATDLWSSWVSSCPLHYTSPNAPSRIDVLGTWLLSILSGHKRYAHVASIRCDVVNPTLLEMSKVISEDSLRNALKKIPEFAGIDWLDKNILHSVYPLLDAPWILDADTTIKPLYGKQEGAVISYNPKKPGRPSHSYHTYIIAGLRQVLGVEVQAGNKHSAKHTQPGLLKIIDDLPIANRPDFVRGDCAFGMDDLMSALEERGQHYLFKLKSSKNVKRHIERVFRDGDWKDVGQGWEGKDGNLKLVGWNKSRRVVVMRRQIKGGVVLSEENENGQISFAFVEPSKKKCKQIMGYEYSVLVTNSEYEICSIAQLYRDRADAENTFDELKNQWGWGGFTTHDLHRCQLSARAIALVYNWWSLFVRLASPDKRLEAITSRPLLMSAIGRKTERKGKTTINLSGLHADFKKAKSALRSVSAMIKRWVEMSAEQLGVTSVWILACEYIKLTIAGINRKSNQKMRLEPLAAFGN